MARRVVGDTAVANHYLLGIIKCHRGTCRHCRALYHLLTARIGLTDGETVDESVLRAVEGEQVSYIEVIVILRLGRDGGDIDVGVAHVKTRARVAAGISAINLHIARDGDVGGADATYQSGIGVVDRTLLHIHVDLYRRPVILFGDICQRVREETDRLVPTATDGLILRTAIVVGVHIEVLHLIAVAVSSFLRLYSGGSHGVGTESRTRIIAATHDVIVHLIGRCHALAVKVDDEDTLVIDG